MLSYIVHRILIMIKPDGFWFDQSETSAKSASATVSPPTAR